MLKQTYKAKLVAEKKAKMSLPYWKPKKTPQEIRSENYTKNQMKYNDSQKEFGTGWGGEKPMMLKAIKTMKTRVKGRSTSDGRMVR